MAEETKHYSIEGHATYKTCTRHSYLSALNLSLRNHEILDKGARASFIWHYFNGYHWCEECSKFNLMKKQKKTLIPITENVFFYSFWLCTDCALFATAP
uniref:Uncharacterized protein n=1 Tax=Meloidogyne enterolobii TaxID=390850 RepID=A0A6V7U8R5_MELEN|nr:unnamed protein product [Meloidogyne enterolobii]